MPNNIQVCIWMLFEQFSHRFSDIWLQGTAIVGNEKSCKPKSFIGRVIREPNISQGYLMGQENAFICGPRSFETLYLASFCAAHVYFLCRKCLEPFGYRLESNSQISRFFTVLGNAGSLSPTLIWKRKKKPASGTIFVFLFRELMGESMCMLEYETGIRQGSIATYFIFFFL